MASIVGIDLGTTNSLIGVMDAGFPVLLADHDGERLTPSVVHYPTQGGAPLVGRPAARMRALEPARTFYSVKRFMGRRAGEEANDTPYSVSGTPGTPLRLVVPDAPPRHLCPEEVCAEILARLRENAARALESEVTAAVITVPAYFNDAQRNATKKAGELAGLKVERILNEPTAAALAYGLDKLGEHARIAVYDLGGGTFDLSILELSNGVFEVLSTNGNTRLGGDDIDAALEAHLSAEAVDRLGPLPPEALARLREAAITAKHTLSEAETATVELPFLRGDASFSHRLTRDTLERLALPILERTRQHCARALADAGLAAGELSEVILVGGQTRMPLVRRLVKEIFGREPNLSQNPDEAVAIGATIQAGILSGAVQNVVLLDVTPLSLGIETFGGLMNVIIPRNTTIPTKAGELFTNAVAGQASVLIRVLQGERERADDNWELGRFELPFDAEARRLGKGEARVGVQFEIDADGILHVLARDVKTGRERLVEMRSAIDVSDEAVETMIAESLDHAFEDMAARVFTEARLKAQEMLPAVGKALEQVGDQLSPEERERIGQLVREVTAAMEAENPNALKKATAALDQATQNLATLLMERAMEAALKRRGVI